MSQEINNNSVASEVEEGAIPSFSGITLKKVNRATSLRGYISDFQEEFRMLTDDYRSDEDMFKLLDRLEERISLLISAIDMADSQVKVGYISNSEGGGISADYRRTLELSLGLPDVLRADDVEGVAGSSLGIALNDVANERKDGGTVVN